MSVSHGELLVRVFNESVTRKTGAVVVETGGGLSTIALATLARTHQAQVFSLDYNADKVSDLKSKAPVVDEIVEFLIGDSIESLKSIAATQDRIDLLFLDSAASALHTWREFSTVEHLLHPGSCVIIDNAAVPGAKHLLSPARKGKVLVPYLLASPFWQVTGHPRAGDSMVSAVQHERPDYADPAYEAPDYIDNWKRQFDINLQ